MKKIDLQDLTGKESGVIEYDDGPIQVHNWSGLTGVPRDVSAGVTIALFDVVDTVTPVLTPHYMMIAMRMHSGEPHDTDGYKSWYITTMEGDSVLVTIHTDWH